MLSLRATNIYVTGTLMQNKIEPVLTIDDLVALFRVSRATLCRWLREARQGKNRLPLPIDSPGRQLIWNRNSIEEYLNENSQTVNAPQVESAAKQRARHNVAMNEIERNHNLKIKPQTGTPKK